MMDDRAGNPAIAFVAPPQPGLAIRCRLDQDVPMVSLDVFMPELSLSAPGLPTEIGQSYLRQAAIELAESSNALRRTIRADLQAGVENYFIEPPDCTRTIGMVEVCNIVTGQCARIFPRLPCVGTRQQVGFDGWGGWGGWGFCGSGAGCGNGAGNIGMGNAWGFGGVASAVFVHPNEVFIRPVPSVDCHDALRVELVVAPKRDACEIDEVLYQRYSQGIVAGALFYLYRIPKQDWTDMALSTKMEAEFRRWTTKASGDRLMQGARGPYRMTTARIL